MKKNSLNENNGEKPAAKDTLLNILLAVLTAALALVLLADQLGLSNSTRQTSGNSDYMSVYAAKKRKASQIYLACGDAVRQNLPGVVCWGDEAAVGNANGSLSGKLDRLADEALFSELKDALARQGHFYNVFGIKIPVKNMGVSREGMAEILVRCGASPMLLAEDFTIPLYGEMKRVELTDGLGNALRFAEQKYAKFDKTSIQGVEGYLYVGAGNYDQYHPHLAFAREYQGVSLTASKGTPVETESAALYRTCLPILYFQSTLGQTEEAFIQSLVRIVECHENPGGYYAVIVRAEEHSSLDEALTAAFGARYIRVEKKAADMAEADHAELARAVFDCLDGQGAFGAVREAVGTALEQLEGDMKEGKRI